MQTAKNYAGQLTPKDIDTEYRNCNFSQSGEVSGTDWKPYRIFPGDDTPRTFVECNLINALPPPGSTLVRCNTSIVERDAGTVTIHGRVAPVTLEVELFPVKKVRTNNRKRTIFLEVRRAQAPEVRAYIRSIGAGPK